MDLLVWLGLLGLGCLSGWVLRGFFPATEVVDRSLAAAPGVAGIYLRFTYTDGRVEVRKFLEAPPTAEWKGRSFARGEWTPDGYIYNEVVSG